MNMNTVVILACISLGLAVVSIFKPQWPLLSTAVILLSVALLVLKG